LTKNSTRNTRVFIFRTQCNFTR